MEIVKSLLAGIICGVVFSVVKLPIPAPNAIAGIVGIIGIFLGYSIVKLLK